MQLLYQQQQHKKKLFNKLLNETVSLTSADCVAIVYVPSCCSIILSHLRVCLLLQFVCYINWFHVLALPRFYTCCATRVRNLFESPNDKSILFDSISITHNNVKFWHMFYYKRYFDPIIISTQCWLKLVVGMCCVSRFLAMCSLMPAIGMNIG